MGLLDRFRRPKRPSVPTLTGDFFAGDLWTALDDLCLNAPVTVCAPSGVLISSHAAVKAALSNRDLGNAPSRFSTLNRRNAAKYPAAALAANIPPFLDAPDHIDRRRDLSAAFHQGLTIITPDLSLLAQDVLRAAPVGPPFDILPYARRFALRVMCRLTGLPEEQAETFKPMTAAFFGLFAPITDPQKFAQMNDVLSGFRTQIAQIAQDAPAGHPGLIGALNARDLTPEVVADNCILIFADGVENIEAAVANVLRVLPAPLADLCAETGGAFETQDLVAEGLRLNSPAPIVPRVARKATVLEGVEVVEGAPVYLALGAANRDPRVFDAAATFDAGRGFDDVLTFGGGRHSCIGARLASLQVAALLTALAPMRPKVSGDRLSYHPRFGHRWPQRFTVTVSHTAG